MLDVGNTNLTSAASETDRAEGGWLPWAWCNLRRNPFGELTRAERVEVAVVDVAAIREKLSEPKTAVQFIGDCGRGKTTRMLVLAASFADAHYVYLPEDEPCPAIAEGSPLLVDEAQRLPKRVRRSIFATGLPLVLATHRDLTRSLRRFGYQVHTECIGQGNNARLLAEVLNRRIEASRLAAGPVPELSVQDAETLVQRFECDFRGIEGYLYERVQAQKFHHGEMRFID